MATEVFIPKMTDHMEAAILNRWLVREGDRVEQGQPILEVETDKASAEVEAPSSGIVAGITLEEGADVPVGTVIAYILQPGEALPSTQPAAAPQPPSVAPAAPTEQSSQPLSAASAPQGGDGAVRATPVARRVARELGIDLATVRGTGPEGRIREEDVRAARQASALSPTAKSTPASDVPSGWTQLSRVQLATGRRMLESVKTAPHFALTTTADVTETLRWQEAAAPGILAETGSRLTITAILVKVCAAALRRYPRANVSFQDGGLRLHSAVNIGVALGTEDGLVVPVVKDADRRTLAEVVVQLARFKSGSAQLKLDDLSGGTFTISNLGMYGIDQFTAILNPPESAILAVGRARKTPVAIADETIALRSLMTLTLSVDHRSLDGIHGARLMNEIREVLEQPKGLV